MSIDRQRQRFNVVGLSIGLLEYNLQIFKPKHGKVWMLLYSIFNDIELNQ